MRSRNWRDHWTGCRNAGQSESPLTDDDRSTLEASEQRLALAEVAHRVWLDGERNSNRSLGMAAF